MGCRRINWTIVVLASVLYMGCSSRVGKVAPSPQPKPVPKTADQKLTFQLVAISEAKVVSSSISSKGVCRDTGYAWAPDGGPYIGDQLLRQSFEVDPHAYIFPDKVLHFMLSGEGYQNGSVYVLPSSKRDPKIGLATIRRYDMNEGSVNKLALPFYSDGSDSADITLAVTKGEYQTLKVFDPTMLLDRVIASDRVKQAIVKPRLAMPSLLKEYGQEAKSTLASGDWGSIDLEVYPVAGSTSLSRPPYMAALAPLPARHSHAAVIVYRSGDLPLKQAARVTVTTKDGKKHHGEADLATSISIDPLLEDIKSIQVDVRPFTQYVFRNARLKADPATSRGAVIGTIPPKVAVSVPGAATMKSVAVYRYESESRWTSERFAPDGKPWYGSAIVPTPPGGLYTYPFTANEVCLELDKAFLASKKDFRAAAYSIPNPSSPVTKLKPMASVMSYPGMNSRFSLIGSPAKGNSYVRVEFEVAGSDWKTIGSSDQCIALIKRALAQNAAWVKKSMVQTPLRYWTNESKQLQITYAEPQKSPVTVSSSIKLPDKNHQVRLVMTMVTGEKIACQPSWLPADGTVYLSFDLNQDKVPVSYISGRPVELKDLKSVELQARTLTRTRPVILRVPEPSKRSKVIGVDIK